MTEDSIRISEETKNRLEDIKENYYEHTTLTYSEAVDVLVAEYDSDTTEDDSGDSQVTRRSAGGDDESTEDDSFHDADESPEEIAAKFRVDE